MKNLKRYIIVLGILLLILICIIVVIKYIEREKNKDVHIGDLSGDIITEIEKLNNYTTYNSIEKMIQNFLLYLRVQNKTAVYSLLDSEYIKQNDINAENVINKISLQGNTENQFQVKEIYVKQDLYYPTYFIKVNNKKDNTEKLYYIFHWDNIEGSFAIEPILEQEYNSYIKGITFFETKEKTIEKNDYNKILRRTLEEEEIVKRYFKDYLQNALYNIEEAYNLIEENYREKKFGSIEAYKKYLNSKQEQLISMDENSVKTIEDFKTEEEYIDYIKNLEIKELEKYQINEYDDYTQYICIDSYGNYYIFNSTSSFQYTVLLDTYTVDLPQFIDKYNHSEEKQKVILNIEKIRDALKEGDYKYVYSKLDENFKSANFPTQTNFEKYIKEKYNSYNTLTYENYDKINNTHIYDIKINDKNSNTINANIVMQLKEGTDFVMSFSASN